MIGSNCVISKNVFVKRSVLDNYNKISSLAKIDNKILFSNNIISLDGTVANIGQTDLTWLIDDARRDSKKTKLEINIDKLISERSSQ